MMMSVTHIFCIIRDEYWSDLNNSDSLSIPAYQFDSLSILIEQGGDKRAQTGLFTYIFFYVIFYNAAHHIQYVYIHI